MEIFRVSWKVSQENSDSKEQTELISIFYVVRRLSSKTIWCMASTCLSVVKVMFSSVPYSLKFHWPPFHSWIRKGVLSMYLLIDFLECHTFLLQIPALGSVLSNFKFVTHITLFSPVQKFTQNLYVLFLFLFL